MLFFAAETHIDKAMDTLLLSICIPTFERDEILKNSLKHLTELPIFSESDQWEIVISDNASADRTQEIGLEFEGRHTGRIHYYRNAENVNDDNFRMALSRGNGLYLKLCNDTLLLTDNGIREMLKCISEHIRSRPILYFRNEDSRDSAHLCESFDNFVENVGYMCTWIAEYGIWRDDFRSLVDFGRASEKMLIQVDATYRILAMKKRAVILRRHFFDLIPKPIHRGYEPSKIFGQNYFAILKPYVENGLVSQNTYNRDKYRMFRYVILSNYLITSPQFQYPRTDYIRNLWLEYKIKWYFYFFYPFALVAIPIAWLRRRVIKR